MQMSNYFILVTTIYNKDIVRFIERSNCSWGIKSVIINLHHSVAQDQPPVFLNAPYSAALPENTAASHTVLIVRARDGDTGQPRKLFLMLEDEDAGHFDLEMSREGDVTVGKLVTTNVSLDREDPKILQNGGIYTFQIRAVELINNEVPADFATSIVTIVVKDVDDLAPVFNEDYFSIKISEDIGKDTPLPGCQFDLITLLHKKKIENAFQPLKLILIFLSMSY